MIYNILRALVGVLNLLIALPVILHIPLYMVVSMIRGRK